MENINVDTLPSLKNLAYHFNWFTASAQMRSMQVMEKNIVPSCGYSRNNPYHKENCPNYILPFNANSFL